MISVTTTKYHKIDKNGDIIKELKYFAEDNMSSPVLAGMFQQLFDVVDEISSQHPIANTMV